MKKVESALTTKWIKWAMYNFKKRSFIMEVKWCPKGKLYFKSGSFPKEYRILVQASQGMLINKQSDIAMMGTLCDVWGGYKCKYPMVIIFYDKKKFYMIHVDKITEEMKMGRVGINEERAGELAYKIDYIK